MRACAHSILHFPSVSTVKPHGFRPRPSSSASTQCTQPAPSISCSSLSIATQATTCPARAVKGLAMKTASSVTDARREWYRSADATNMISLGAVPFLHHFASVCQPGLLDVLCIQSHNSHLPCACCIGDIRVHNHPLRIPIRRSHAPSSQLVCVTHSTPAPSTT